MAVLIALYCAPVLAIAFAECHLVAGWEVLLFDAMRRPEVLPQPGAGFRLRTLGGVADSFAHRLTKVTQNMISRDYTKEVGLPSHKKNVSRPLAFIVLAAVAVTISFGVAGVVAKAREHDAAEKAPTGAGSAVTAPAIPATESAAAK